MASTTTTSGAGVVAHPSGQRGTLRTVQGQEMPVKGYERGEEVVLVLLSGGEMPLCDEDLDPAVLEYASARGVIRLQGEGHLEDSSLVRFRADGDAEVIQRRAYVRVTTPQPVTVEAQPDPLYAHTIDLSGGGMLISGAPRLRQGDAVTFVVHLEPDQDPIQGLARVVRSHADGRRALAFVQIAESDRQRLIRFIFDRLRVGRAKTRGDLV